MAALSDTQLPVYFNGRYCRVCVTIVSSTTSFSSCSWNSIVPKGQESAVSVVCSVLLPALVGALSKSRCLTTTTRKKIRRSYDDMAGWKDWLSSSSSVSSFAERWRGEKKSQTSWSNPTKPIVDDRRELLTYFHHGIVRSKFNSKLRITR